MFGSSSFRIAWMGRRGDVEGLRRVLANRPDSVGQHRGRLDINLASRRRAVQALASIPLDEAEPALGEALSDPAEEVRYDSALALADRGTPAAIETLAYACGGWDPELWPHARAAAISALKSAEHPRAAVDYAEGLLRPERQDDLASEDREVLRGLLGDDLASPLAHQVASLLAEALGAEDATEADRAAVVLTWLGPAGAQAAMAGLKSAPASARAAHVLAELHGEEALEPLTNLLLEGEDGGARAAAAKALAELSSPMAIEPLLQATHDRERRVREAALAGIDRYGTLAIVEQLARAMGGEPGSSGAEAWYRHRRT